MTITPKPITDRTRRIEDRSPIGTRYRDSSTGSYYTLVAYSLDATTPHLAHPILIGDYQFDTTRTWYDGLADGSVTMESAREIVTDDEVLEVAPADPEKSTRARAAAMNRNEESARSTSDLWSVLAFDDLNTDEEIAAFHAWAEAELELRKAEMTLARAARDRAGKLQRIVNLKGSQAAAGRVVGLNQSSISRSLKTLPQATD